MLISTKNFGEIEISEDKIITFDEGIPGFEKLKKYTIIFEEEENKGEKKSTFCWLQSIEEKETAFIIMDVFNILPDYNPLVNTEDLKALGDIEKDELLIYNIVVIPPCVSKMSVNLKAPIIININTGKAKQVVATNEDYSIKYCFYEKIKEMNGGE